MDYDFLIIGGGSAGYAGARTAADLGLKTAVVEGGRDVGGLCILRGCMPSKTLIESANRYLTLRHAAVFGLHAGDIGYDAHAIIKRKRALIGEFADYRAEQLETGKFDFIRGQAGFVDDHTIRVQLRDGGEQTLTAKSFLICSGSVISWPDIPGLREINALTSDDVLDLAEIPSSIIILGAGPVALEMAHYYNALNTKVTVLQRGEQLLSGVDADAAQALETALRERGMDIFTKTKLLRLEGEKDKRRAVFLHDGVEKTIEADQVLNALGRTPNLASLNLEKAGIELEGSCIRTNPHQQTCVPHIFAAGDCSDQLEVVHIAIEHGEIAGRNAARLLAGKKPEASSDDRLKLFAVFTEPQVAIVGLSEEEAQKKGIKYLTAKYPFNDHGKSQVMNELAGFVKLMVDAETREILGGTVVGPHGSDLIHEIVVAMRFHATAGQLATIPHYHPTLSEIWTYPAADLAEA